MEYDSPMKINFSKKIRFIYDLYYDGFVNMRVGKTLWILIFMKLFILFVIIKWLFFPDVMQENFKTDKARSAYILQQLTQESK